MSTKAPDSPEQTLEKPTQDGDLRNVLISHLKGAVLPGETPLDDTGLEQTAEFLLATATSREAASSALSVESATSGRRHLRIAVVNDDMPFLVDSVAATITAQGLSIDRLIHPVVPIQREAAGRLSAIGEPGIIHPSFKAESMIYIETPRVDAKQRKELMAALEVTLGDVRAAVNDWPKMRAVMLGDSRELVECGNDEAIENANLLNWLNDGMLTQLGHVTRSRDGTLSEAYGICRMSASEVLAPDSFNRAFDWFDEPNEDGTERSLLIIKANRLSNVHRRAALDLFIVARRTQGKVTALSVHAGVWTSAGLAAPPADVPVIRTRVETLTKELGFSAKGHAGKALVHAFTTLPHDLLVAFSKPDVSGLATALMSLVDRPRPRLVLIKSPLGRHVYAFVWLPRDMLSTGTRAADSGLAA